MTNVDQSMNFFRHCFPPASKKAVKKVPMKYLIGKYYEHRYDVSCSMYFLSVLVCKEGNSYNYVFSLSFFHFIFCFEEFGIKDGAYRTRYTLLYHNYEFIESEKEILRKEKEVGVAKMKEKKKKWRTYARNWQKKI